jgi:RNA polymerase sigma-70 factor (ECF subfamily)
VTTERDASASELALLERVARGDRAAFTSLYRLWAPRVFRFVMRLLGDVAKAEEVTDDVMVEIWKSAAGFEARSKPTTWALGIARFKALSELRVRRPEAGALDEVGALADPNDSAAQALERGDVAARVRAAISQLSPEQREVVELTFYHGLSYPEIARIARCPVGTVKTRMFHARRRLAPALAGMREESS